MNKWISLKETREEKMIVTTEEGTGYIRGRGGLSGGGGAPRNQQMTEKWESEIWGAVSARQLPRSTMNGRHPTNGSNLKGAARPRPAPPPARRPQHGQSRPTSARSSAFWSRRAAWGARCHPTGPSPAATAAREKPTHSSSAIFSPIPRSLRDHRARG